MDGRRQENVATFGSRVRQLADGSFAAFSAGPTVSNGTTILTVDATGNLTGWHASTVAEKSPISARTVHS